MHRQQVVVVLVWLCVVTMFSRGSSAQPDLTLPPGLDPSALRLIESDTPAGHRARLSLDEVLESLRGMDSVPPERESPPPPEAVRLYVSGRAKALSGQTIDAARDLGAAIQLDPMSTAANEALGELLLQQGMVPAGMSAYRRAIDAGSSTAGVILDVASELMRQGDNERAAILLSRGLTSADARDRSGFARPLLLERLTEALERMGWVRASIEAGREAFDRLEDIEPAQRSAVLARMLRGLPTRWVELGDAARSIGDASLASELYARAAESGADWTTLAPRRAHAAISAGLREEALDAVLPIEAPHRIAAGRTAELLGWLKANGVEQQLLSDRVEMAIAASEHEPPRLAARHAIARAAVAPSREQAISILSLALIETPEHTGLAETIAGIAQSPSELLAPIHAMPRTARTLARAWLDNRPRNNATVDAVPVEDAHVVSGRHLRAALWLELGRADLAVQALGEKPTPSTITAEALAGDGRWEEFDQILAGLSDPLDRAVALLYAQRLNEVDQILSPLLSGEEHPTRAAHIGARTALVRGDAERAADLFDGALQTDAYDTFALRGLVSLRMPGGAVTDNRAFEAALAALRIADPDEELVVQMDVRIIANQRGLEPAFQRLLPVLEHSPSLAGTAVELATAGDASIAERVEQTLARLFEIAPTDARVGTSLALLYAQQGKTEQAAQVLQSLAQHDESAAELYESLLAERMQRGEEAREMRINRLRTGPASISRRLRLAELIAGQSPVEASEIFLKALPAGATPNSQQANIIARTILAAGQASERERSAASASATLSMLAATDAMQIDLPWQLRLLEFSMLVISDQAEPQTVAQSIRKLTNSIEEPADALALARQYRGERADVGSTLSRARAEVAYALAGALYFQGLEDASLAVYRVSLDHDPEHVWANNDLGYFLLERNESLEEAAVLVEKAFAQRPDELNIIDSLGWLRYKQGRLLDDDKGQGAVSILDNARKSEAGADNETVHDHAGDALWLVGRREEAVQAWRTALDLVEALLARIPEGSLALERVLEQRSKLEAKLEAAISGQEPPVEPTSYAPESHRTP